MSQSATSEREFWQALRPEEQVLLLCARSHLDAELEQQLHGILAQPLDWAYLGQAAQRHRVVPLLAHCLRTYAAQSVPPALLEQLRASFVANDGHNRFRTGELLRLIDLLAQHKIEAVPLKGPALAMRLYGSITLRHFGDLDILVRQRDAQLAKQLLLAEGYRLSFQLAEAQEDAYQRFQHHYALVRAAGGIVLELHYRIRENYFAVDFDTADLWRRLDTLALGGRSISVLSIADTLLTLCVHGASHSWQRLFWICDIAELLQAYPGLNWELAIGQASRLGCARMLRLGLILARDVLAAPVPAHISQWINADGDAMRLTAQVRARLFVASDNLPPLNESIPFHLKARERWRDRARYCIRLALTPTEGDWSLVALPRWLSWFYYLLRPFRLAWAYRTRLYSRA